jgi:hypothetical protein
MTMRRDFIGKAAGVMAGVVFCGCGLLHPPGAHAQAPVRRREVVVNGRRVKLSSRPYRATTKDLNSSTKCAFT